MSGTSRLPMEVELAFELMPCQALRKTYDAGDELHPCAYFGEWGHYHSYDYATAGPPSAPTIELPVSYAGKRPLVPEMLTGCRKSPILCVGINPNLPGWSPRNRHAIHPYFDDVLQYAHYFRYRTRDKLQIPLVEYEARIGSEKDDPYIRRPIEELGAAIPVERASVLMYDQYQRLLDGLADRMQWGDHKLAVGEDIAYANMVACASARWLEEPNSNYPDMPAMGRTRAKGIVGECFYKRRYFLRQLLQSLPSVILVFSKTTAREFISVLGPRFSKGDPKPNEPLADLFQREVRLRYGRLSDGTELDARVIFMPHASSRPDEFEQMLVPCVDQLVEEVNRGDLVYNPGTGHLRRGRGACVFCANSLYRIGNCDYLAELTPLNTDMQPLAADVDNGALADKREQMKLLDEFLAAPVRESGELELMAETPVPAPMVLLGKVVSMAGAPIDQGAIYIKDGRIVAVQSADAPDPTGFEQAARIATDGVIYPGLMDLHNHLPYNVLPLWQPPRRFEERNQWRRRPEYKRDVTQPMDLLVGSGQGAIKAVVRYIEVKLLLGGVTSGQGMNSRYKGDRSYGGLCRNFEASHHQDLPSAGTRLPDLEVGDVPAMRASLDTGKPYFYHLAEGVDSSARQNYVLLREQELLRKNLICIHSLALTPVQHEELAAAGARVVWSPLSNSLLYGETIDPRVLKDAGTLFGLGSDWTPSGSRNILQELKVAWLCSQQAGNVFSCEDLVRAVTIDAARAAAWDRLLGSIEPGKLADLLVLDALPGVDDPYENLVRATEREVRLVVIGGRARHGDKPLMEKAGLPAAQLEDIRVGGRDKSLYLHEPGSPLANLSLAKARARLEEALGDLDAIRNGAVVFEPLSSEPGLELELDMQAEEFDDEPQLMAPLPPLASVALDPLTVVDDPGYFDALEAVSHLPAFYKGASGLRGFYK